MRQQIQTKTLILTLRAIQAFFAATRRRAFSPPKTDNITADNNPTGTTPRIEHQQHHAIVQVLYQYAPCLSIRHLCLSHGGKTRRM